MQDIKENKKNIAPAIAGVEWIAAADNLRFWKFLIANCASYEAIAVSDENVAKERLHDLLRKEPGQVFLLLNQIKNLTNKKLAIYLLEQYFNPAEMITSNSATPPPELEELNKHVEALRGFLATCVEIEKILHPIINSICPWVLNTNDGYYYSLYRDICRCAYNIDMYACDYMANPPEPQKLPEILAIIKQEKSVNENIAKLIESKPHLVRDVIEKLRQSYFHLFAEKIKINAKQRAENHFDDIHLKWFIIINPAGVSHYLTEINSRLNNLRDKEQATDLLKQCFRVEIFNEVANFLTAHHGGGFLDADDYRHPLHPVLKIIKQRRTMEASLLTVSPSVNNTDHPPLAPNIASPATQTTTPATSSNNQAPQSAPAVIPASNAPTGSAGSQEIKVGAPPSPATSEAKVTPAITWFDEAITALRRMPPSDENYKNAVSYFRNAYNCFQAENTILGIAYTQASAWMLISFLLHNSTPETRNEAKFLYQAITAKNQAIGPNNAQNVHEQLRALLTAKGYDADEISSLFDSWRHIEAFIQQDLAAQTTVLATSSNNQAPQSAPAVRPASNAPTGSAGSQEIKAETPPPPVGSARTISFAYDPALQARALPQILARFDEGITLRNGRHYFEALRAFNDVHCYFYFQPQDTTEFMAYAQASAWMVIQLLFLQTTKNNYEYAEIYYKRITDKNEAIGVVNTQSVVKAVYALLGKSYRTEYVYHLIIDCEQKIAQCRAQYLSSAASSLPSPATTQTTALAPSSNNQGPQPIPPVPAKHADAVLERKSGTANIPATTPSATGAPAAASSSAPSPAIPTASSTSGSSNATATTDSNSSSQRLAGSWFNLTNEQDRTLTEINSLLNNTRDLKLAESSLAALSSPSAAVLATLSVFGPDSLTFTFPSSSGTTSQMTPPLFAKTGAQGKKPAKGTSQNTAPLRSNPTSSAANNLTSLIIPPPAAAMAFGSVPVSTSLSDSSEHKAARGLASSAVETISNKGKAQQLTPIVSPAASVAAAPNPSTTPATDSNASTPGTALEKQEVTLINQTSPPANIPESKKTIELGQNLVSPEDNSSSSDATKSATTTPPSNILSSTTETTAAVVTNSDSKKPSEESKLSMPLPLPVATGLVTQGFLAAKEKPILVTSLDEANHVTLTGEALMLNFDKEDKATEKWKLIDKATPCFQVACEYLKTADQPCFQQRVMFNLGVALFKKAELTSEDPSQAKSFFIEAKFYFGEVRNLWGKIHQDTTNPAKNKHEQAKTWLDSCKKKIASLDKKLRQQALTATKP